MLYKIYFFGSKPFLLPKKYSQNRRYHILYDKIAGKMQKQIIKLDSSVFNCYNKTG